MFGDDFSIKFSARTCNNKCTILHIDNFNLNARSKRSINFPVELFHLSSFYIEYFKNSHNAMKIENLQNQCINIHHSEYSKLSVKKKIDYIKSYNHLKIISYEFLKVLFCKTSILLIFRAQTTPISMVHLQKTQLCFFRLELQMMQTSKKDFCGSKRIKFSPDGKKGSSSLPRTTSIVSKKGILD